MKYKQILQDIQKQAHTTNQHVTLNRHPTFSCFKVYMPEIKIIAQRNEFSQLSN